MTGADGPAAGDLGIGPGMRIWVGGHNLDAKRAVAPFLVGVARPVEGPLDVAVVCPSAPDEAAYFCSKVRSRLAAGSRLYVLVPLLSDGSSDPRFLGGLEGIESLSGCSCRDDVIPGFGLIDVRRH